jgi:hypothetical protein
MRFLVGDTALALVVLCQARTVLCLVIDDAPRDGLRMSAKLKQICLFPSLCMHPDCC